MNDTTKTEPLPAGGSPLDGGVVPLVEHLNATAHWCLIEGNGDDEVHRALLTAATEIARLTMCLRIANEQAEHFEREWYLRGDALDKIAERTGSDDPCRALVQIAREALRHNVGDERRR